MNIEELHAYCLSKKAATDTFPFDDVNLVFKVKGKMFALISLDKERDNIALKCDPERAVSLREEYEDIIPAPHFNKKYWNLLYTDKELKRELICELIDHSYELVVAKLTKKLREELNNE
ncbi:MAG: MmcQ/YjbR family DNA-binding protein [Candidatus Azobacteroides sp.]|nr:MmcQ/YjbR family DNA-binding protein [Candidatus Azobacteroides sp.]